MDITCSAAGIFLTMKPLYVLLFTFLLVGCKTVKDVPYFQNAAEFDGSQGALLYDMTIKPKDKLNIFVHSSQPEAVAQFNFTEPRQLGVYSSSLSGVRLQQSREGQFHQYLVDNDGNIDFPVVGTLHLGGLTIEQANSLVKEKIAPYVTTDYTINTLIVNYEISVLGEVKRPNTFTIRRNKCTVLEALAMAGDMTIYGRRDNVKLRDANLLNSPYYYMQQRDVLYVEPNEVMAQNTKIGRTRQLWIRGASITVSLGSLLYRVLK